MSKQIIAIDIDDVLASHVEGLVAYSNKTFGTHLTMDDYDEYWAKMWQVDDVEAERRAKLYHESGVIADFLHQKEAVPILRQLSKKFRLIIITSRRNSIMAITKTWLDRHYPSIFNAIYHAGIWDEGISRKAVSASKADVCKKAGAHYLIDDQLKHCLAASELGLNTLLFGDYSWNQIDKLPRGVTRCKDWKAVLEYFNARG